MKRVLKYAEVKEKFNSMLEKGFSVEDIEKKLTQMIAENPHDSVKYQKAFFATIKDIDLDMAVKYGENVIKEDEDPKFMKVLAVRYKRIGNNSKYNALINRKIPIIELKNTLDNFIERETTFNIIEEYIIRFIDAYPDLMLDVNKVVFGKLKDKYTKEALPYGKEVVKAEQNPKFIKVLVARFKTFGYMEEYNKLNNILQLTE